MLEITATTSTIAVMREYAAANNIDLGGATRRQDIADIIQAADAKRAATATQGTPTGDGDEVEQDPAKTPEDTPTDDETKTDETNGAEQDDGEIVIEPLFDRVLQGLRLPMRGDDVTALHARLEEKGLSVGTDRANGIYGGRTAYAVRVFQARNRLIVDGRVGKYTAAALGFTWQG